MDRRETNIINLLELMITCKLIFGRLEMVKFPVTACKLVNTHFSPD